ncbi:prolyl oligopeptidase family serine peptidase [Saccharopolyspora elongata]|uniref:prolyl oligopeptidase family serine peptidase n=1 Tax=Saccharopolyspora elongata TaxID=2530387 RepID=UPI001F3DA087|nr:prolyl oligopeptidase family serine peptidase [Saccharopolyspora elongata]
MTTPAAVSTTYLWTDDPRWLLYLQDTDGNEDWHLYRVDLDSPDVPAVVLTPMEQGSRVFGAEPLPSVPGSVLVAMNRRPMSIDLFRIDVATGETTLHLEQADPRGHVLLDRNGEPAFHSLLAEDGAHEFSAIDPGTGQKRLLRRIGGAEHPVGVQPQLVTPDGKGLLVGTYQDSDDLRLVRIDRETGEEKLVPLRRRSRRPRPGGRHAGPLAHHHDRPDPHPAAGRPGRQRVRVVQAESDNIVASLRDRGVPVEYIVAEDEGHGFENPENQFRLYRAIERHFAEHLGGRRDTSAPA